MGKLPHILSKYGFGLEGPPHIIYPRLDKIIWGALICGTKNL